MDKISDEMVAAFDAAYDACVCPDKRTGYCCIRAGLEAAVPLKAEQVLRQGIAALNAQREIAAHTAMEGCDRCCGPVGEVEDFLRQCPSVQSWRATIMSFRGLADASGVSE